MWTVVMLRHNKDDMVRVNNTYRAASIRADCLEELHNLSRDNRVTDSVNRTITIDAAGYYR